MENAVIPDKFKCFFWDVTIKDINIIDHQIFIIERLLNEGDQQTLEWLFRTFSLEQIKNAVAISRGLTMKTALCWQNFFQLKEEEMRCFGRSSINPE